MMNTNESMNSLIAPPKANETATRIEPADTTNSEKGTWYTSRVMITNTKPYTHANKALRIAGSRTKDRHDVVSTHSAFLPSTSISTGTTTTTSTQL